MGDKAEQVHGDVAGVGDVAGTGRPGEMFLGDVQVVADCAEHGVWRWTGAWFERVQSTVKYIWGWCGSGQF